MEKNCDVLVVGSGPSGSSAARYTAMNGAKTIFIDKKEEIGSPVQCAEGIGAYLIPYLPFNIPKEQFIWNMDGMYFQVDDLCLEKQGEYWQSYSVDRQKFDKWLSQQAIEKGAELISNAELTDLEVDQEKNVQKAIIHKNDKIITIKPKAVIAADGVESAVLKLLGLYNPRVENIANVYSWEMKNLNLFNSNLEQVFIGSFAEGGYGYIFPKSRNTANIGVGGRFNSNQMKKHFEEFLEISHVKKQLKNSEYILEKTKKAVIGDLTKKLITNNVILTGDAANHNLKPFIEGILPSIISGDIAGKKIVDMLQGKSVSQKNYQHDLNQALSQEFKISKSLEKTIFEIFSKKDTKKYLQFFALVTELLTPDEIKQTEHLNYNQLKTNLSGKIDGK